MTSDAGVAVGVFTTGSWDWDVGVAETGDPPQAFRERTSTPITAQNVIFCFISFSSLGEYHLFLVIVAQLSWADLFNHFQKYLKALKNSPH